MADVAVERLAAAGLRALRDLEPARARLRASRHNQRYWDGSTTSASAPARIRSRATPRAAAGAGRTCATLSATAARVRRATARAVATDGGAHAAHAPSRTSW